MSRIGKLPVSLPDKVSVELLPGNVLKVKGPLGELSQKIDPDIKVTIEDNEIKFERRVQFRAVLGRTCGNPRRAGRRPSSQPCRDGKQGLR